MSVGVCVINRNGISLAADSAGTFTGRKMFYNTVNKVFKISQKNICGAIIYGNLSIYNVSVEQILKEFSLYLDSFEAISDFYDIIPAFQEFIKTKNNYYKFNDSEVIPCQALITALINDWGMKIQSVINDPDVTEKISDIIKEFKNTIAASAKVKDFDVNQHIDNTYRNFYNAEIIKVVPKIDSFADTKEELWSGICNYFNLQLNREDCNISGIFFAGYGKEDAYAKYIGIEVRTVVGGKIKYIESGKYEARSNNARIQPLAQDDIVYTFCKGISQEYIDSIPEQIGIAISKKVDSLPNNFTDDQKGELRKQFADVIAEVKDYINKTVRKDHIDPLIESVKLITLPEMAFLAENLVNMTSLKRTYCLDGQQQTVGGPTDVAVISKGDGFFWVKRK